MKHLIVKVKKVKRVKLLRVRDRKPGNFKTEVRTIKPVTLGEEGGFEQRLKLSEKHHRVRMNKLNHSWLKLFALLIVMFNIVKKIHNAVRV